MIHRRTGLVLLALLAVMFVMTFCAAAVSASFQSFPVKHGNWAKHELMPPYRFSGSVFSPTGDPDEIATASLGPGGRWLTGEAGDLIGAQPGESGWAGNRGAVRLAILRYVMQCFQVVK